MNLREFVRESNFIEGIVREPTASEVLAHENLIASPTITVEALCSFVKAIQPDAILRTRPGLNVAVGPYHPPKGGPEIELELVKILRGATRGASEQQIFWVHHRYENLHPFTDGNGRSGRAIWLWMMGGISPRLFLHEWYYQSLRIRLNEALPHPNLLQ